MPVLHPAYLRGQAYLLAHNGTAAAAQFQKLLDHRGIVGNFVTGALATHKRFYEKVIKVKAEDLVATFLKLRKRMFRTE
ncbi:MAG: hypothetical protein WBV98_11020 [Candidatus Sulfotelmatobacter sp.]